MIDFLTAPYPLRKSTAYEWAFIIGSGVFVAFFLILFQPFGTREFQMENKYLFLAGYGVVISTTVFLMTRLFPLLSSSTWFLEENWTVGKHILFLIVAFSIAIFTCYIYKDIFLGFPISWKGFAGFYPVALSVAVFPITGLVVGDYILKLQRYAKGAEAATRHISKKATRKEPVVLILPDENGKTVLKTSPDHLLFLQAADNYVEVHHIEGEKNMRTVIRNSLSALENLLEPHGFSRCHRSFLANLNCVEKVSGNAQGYRLHFSQINQSVPVARGRSAEVLEKLR